MYYVSSWKHICQQKRKDNGDMLGTRKALKITLRFRRDHLFLFWSIFFWGLLIFPSPSSQGATCKEFPAISQAEWESYPSREGEYKNCPFGYVITIPEGFIARGEAPSHTEHGFGIWFWVSNHFTGQIWVDGSAASPEGDFPLDEEADKRIEWIEKDAKAIISVQKTHIMLDTLPAIRLIIQYACSGDRTMVNDYFFALNGSAFEYTIALSADIVKYEEYKPILEQLARTFRLTEESCK